MAGRRCHPIPRLESSANAEVMLTVSGPSPRSLPSLSPKHHQSFFKRNLLLMEAWSVNQMKTHLLWAGEESSFLISHLLVLLSLPLKKPG